MTRASRSAPIPAIPEAALSDLPLFPLPDTVLLPRTLMSLHIFEPRYRAMMEDCLRGHRMLAIATIIRVAPDTRIAPPGSFAAAPESAGEPVPPIHDVSGIGRLRKSTRQADGCFDILLEGIGRVDVTDELGPSKPYRRARARLLADDATDPAGQLDAALFNLRALSARVLAGGAARGGDLVASLNEVTDPAALVDILAAAAVDDPVDRQRVLRTPSVVERVSLVAGLLGAMMVADGRSRASPKNVPRWGVLLGKA